MDLKETFATINRMEAAGTLDRWAVGGATGATFFLEPLVTEDVDIFVHLKPAPGQFLISLEPIYQFLRAEGARQIGEYLVIGGWPVQFLPLTTPLVEEALEQAIETDAEGVRIRVFTAEYLVAIALETGRAKDKARIQLFLESGILDLDRLVEILARHGLTARWRKIEQLLKEGT